MQAALGAILRRGGSTILVVLLVAAIIFLLTRATSGDPAVILAGDNATPAQIALIREKLGLNQPLHTQFIVWITAIVSGDMGTSVFTGTPVLELIGQRLEPTLSLTVATIMFTTLVAVPAGMIAASRLGGFVDRIVMMASVAGFSLPTFVIGYLLIFVFAVNLKLLPVQGYVRLTDGVLPWLVHLILPVLSLAGVCIALIARMARAAMLDVLDQDYMRTAKAKGLSRSTILWRHGLRNAGIPIVTTIGASFALLVGGVVVTETVFNIPGIGRLVFDAILKRDYPIIQGVMLVLSFTYVAINALIEMTYVLIDPRVAQQ